MPPYLSISRRTRFTNRGTVEVIAAYTVSNRMLLPSVFNPWSRSIAISRPPCRSGT